MCASMVDIQSATAEIRRGKRETERKKTRMSADAQRHGRPAEYRWCPQRKFVISFLVARHKIWLIPTGRVPCSNAGNIGERKIWTQSIFYTWQNSVTEQQPWKMYNCIYSVPAQETAKHLAKFGWLPLSDILQ